MKPFNYFYLLMTAIICAVVLQAQRNDNYHRLDKTRWLPVHERFVLIDTPKGIRIGSSRQQHGALVIYGNMQFIISDSTGQLVLRDSLGVWHMTDCKRALEAVYQTLLTQYKRYNQ